MAERRPWLSQVRPPVSGTGGNQLDALVVGAGPAGLAASRALQRRGISHRVMEKGDQPAAIWAHLYDSLTLHTGRHMSHLGERPFAKGTPLFVPRKDFVRYLQDYAAAFALPVDCSVEVRSLHLNGSGWMAETSRGILSARTLVLATGIVSNPRWPKLDGMADFGGRLMHSVDYKRPHGFAGQRVLVVGVGNSGGEIGSELARAGAAVTMAVRSGANVVPLEIGGIPIQYLSYWLRKLPRPAQEWVSERVRAMSERKHGPPVLPRPAHNALDAIPLIGFNLVNAIRDGSVAVRPGVERLTPAGARFVDGREELFDTILLATGFTAAVQPLGDLVRLDERGFARRRDRVVSDDQRGLFLIGHNYDSGGGIANIRWDAPRLAARVAEALR